MDISPVEIRVQTLSELNDYLNDSIKKEVKKQLENLLHRISQGEGLPFDLIKEKYGNLAEGDESTLQKPKKKKIDSINKCQARVSAGDRCSRRCKLPERFCGGHINSRPYGIISLSDTEDSSLSESRISE